MLKLTNGNIPKPLLKLYTSNKYIHAHFTRQAHHFHSKRETTEFVYRTFAFQSVFILNTIIPNIDNNVSFTRFKYLLKSSYYLMIFLLDTSNSNTIPLVLSLYYPILNFKYY